MAHYRIKPGKIGNFLINIYYDIEYDVVSTYKKIEKAFLPVSKDEMVERGWYYYDFLVVTADAYIDHPSFGTAIIARVLELSLIHI